MRIISAIVVLYLVSCSPPQAEPPPDPNAAIQVGEAQQLPNTLPAASAERPRYVGRWTAVSMSCEDPAWRWEAQRLSTQGEVSCDFNDVQMTPTGYTIQASCTAEGTSSQETIQLAFAESARAMMVSGGPWGAEIGLTYCGPLE